MNQPPAAESAIREKLSAYTDPYLGQTLGEAKAIKSLAMIWVACARKYCGQFIYWRAHAANFLLLSIRLDEKEHSRFENGRAVRRGPGNRPGPARGANIGQGSAGSPAHRLRQPRPQDRISLLVAGEAGAKRRGAVAL